MKYLGSVAVALVGVALSAGVQADEVKVKYTGKVSGKNVNMQISQDAGTLYAGVIRLTAGLDSHGVDSVEQEDYLEEGRKDSFLAYSVDPYQRIASGYKRYEKSVLDATDFHTDAAVRLSNVTELYSYAYAGSLTNATKAAGFQLALWEIFNDDANLGSGMLRKTSRTNSAVLGEAQTLLHNLSFDTWSAPAAQYQLTYYSSPDYRDYLVASPVPEPETWGLLVGGLGLFGWRNRARKAS